MLEETLTYIMAREKILVTKSTLPDYDRYCSVIKEMWESHWLTNSGKMHEELEKKLKRRFKSGNVSLFTNGHLALETALSSLELEGEVITTPFTFVSTTHAIVRNNLTPVFCDIKEDDFTIDADKIENLITDKTCAIVPVHVYGNICDVEKIEAIAKKHNLKVIYDAAHAFDEKYKGQSVANFGDVSMFSFHATKVFNTIEGGCLSYNDNNLKTKIEELKNFGIKDPEVVDYVGMNAKMNEFQAAMGLCNLEELKENIKKRKKIFLYYRKLLSSVKGIKLSTMNEDVTYNYSYLPIVVLDCYGRSREELIEKLNENNIFPRKYFYPLISELECYKDLKKNETPIALDISNRVLTLPLYPDLDLKVVKEICDLIKEFERKC